MNSIINYFKEKRRLFLSWLLSYVIIIIIALLISSIAYIQAVRVIESEINDSHVAMLNQLKQTVDTKLNDIEKILKTIMLDKNINKQNDEIIDPIYNISMLDAISTIKTCEISNSFIDDIFIYYPNRNMVVSGNGTCGYLEYFDIYYKGKITDKTAWINFLKKKHVKEFCPMSSLNTENPNMGGIVFLQSISYDNYTKDYATLGIVLNNKFLEQSLSSFNGIPEGNSVIVNSKNELVAALKKKINFDVTDFKIEDSHGIKSYKNGKSKFELVYINSDIVDWRYITIIPRAVFAKKARDVINVMLLCTLLCLVGGFIAAFIFAGRNYNPIDNIMQIFLKTGKFKFDKRLSEFKMIENSMLNIIDENKSIVLTLEQQKSVLKSNFLNRLVKGYIKDSVVLDDIFSTYGIEFKGKNFILIMFELEGLGVIYSPNGSRNEENAIELAHFVIENIMEELINKEYDCLFFEVDQAMVCLVNSEKLSGDNQDNIKNIIINGKNIIMDKFSIQFTCSFSSMHSTLEGIPDAYRECLEAAEYKLVIGSNNIIRYSDIHVFGSNSFSNAYSIEVQQQFINCIRAGDFIQAKQVMNRIFEKNFVNSNISLDMARCLMFAIINTMLNTINDIYTVVDNKFLENLNPVHKLIQCKTVYEMKEQMDSILLKIEDYNDTKKKGTSSSKIKDIMAYIEEHYYDHNLSVSSVASEFDLNPVYLSRFFKEQTGEGVLNTINKIRMEKAKVFLKDIELNIKNISEMVGFLNSTVFIRTFKKYEGITPGKYRELSNIEYNS